MKCEKPIRGQSSRLRTKPALPPNSMVSTISRPSRKQKGGEGEARNASEGAKVTSLEKAAEIAVINSIKSKIGPQEHQSSQLKRKEYSTASKRRQGAKEAPQKESSQPNYQKDSSNVKINHHSTNMGAKSVIHFYSQSQEIMKNISEEHPSKSSKKSGDKSTKIGRGLADSQIQEKQMSLRTADDKTPKNNKNQQPTPRTTQPTNTQKVKNQEYLYLQSQITPCLSQQSVSVILQRVDMTLPLPLKSQSRSQLKRNGQAALTDIKKIQIHLSQPSLKIDQAQKRARSGLRGSDSKTENSTHAPSSAKTPVDQSHLDLESLLLTQTQEAVHTQSAINSSRNKRDKAQNVNYSLFFQDFDNLSEAEENKKKREVKKIEKEAKAQRLVEEVDVKDQFMQKGVPSNNKSSKDKKKVRKVQMQCQEEVETQTLSDKDANKISKGKNNKKLPNKEIQDKNSSPQVCSQNLGNLNSTQVSKDQREFEKDEKNAIMGDASYDSNPSILINIPLLIKESTQSLQNASLLGLENLIEEDSQKQIISMHQAVEEVHSVSSKGEQVMLLAKPVPANLIHLSESDIFSQIEAQSLTISQASENNKISIAPAESLKALDLTESLTQFENQEIIKSIAKKRQVKLHEKLALQDKKEATRETEQSSLNYRERSLDISKNEESKHERNTEETKQVVSSCDNHAIEEVQINTTVAVKESLVEEAERKEYCMSGPIVVRGQLIPNPFDKQIRNQGIDFIDFNNSTTENNTYKPAMIQKEQDQQQKTQTHFIHKKQSQCNIKRISGVSYIKRSESKQLNVRNNYEKLAPLVIQGSYNLPQRHESQETLEKIQEIVQKLLFSEDSYFVCTAFESANEIAMKNYLLKPHKRLQIAKGQIYTVVRGGFKECWKFIKDKFFFVIHLKYDSTNLAKNIPLEDLNDRDKVSKFIINSDLCLGVLTKRGNASIKSMLKVYKMDPEIMNLMKPTHELQKDETKVLSQVDSLSQVDKDQMMSQVTQSQSSHKNFDIASHINCQGAQISGINTIALMMRFELYVGERNWKSINRETQTMLNTFMSCCEEYLHPYLLEWNQIRTSVIQSKISPKDETIFKIQLDSSKKENIVEDQSLWQNINDFQLSQELQTMPQLDEQLWKFENNPNEIMNQLKNSVPIPVTLINTRDCFVYDLYIKETIVDLGKGRENTVKKEYFFNLDNVPENYRTVVGISKDEVINDVERMRVGVTTYENFYTHDEMKNMEHMIEETEKKSLINAFLPMTAQKTFSGNTLKRTKFFFGFRYMWTRTQLQEPLSNVAAGVRADVSQPPVWMKTVLEEPLVNAGIVEKDFINSVALNVYHDGSEGLAQHFDDATRFKQPIYTLRLFSDSRLSFGSQFYGFCNGAFTIPLPRGCICVMEEGSYSANGVKHCIRPCDMTGKSSAVILRQMHPNVVHEAIRYDRHVDLPMWMSSLRLEDDAVPFYQQKELECQELEKLQAPGAQSHVQGGGYLEPKKRGPKFSVHTLERRLQKQREKDEKDVKRVIDDMVKRVEFKIKEEKDIMSRFMVYKPIQSQKEEGKTNINTTIENNGLQDSTITELSSLSTTKIPLGCIASQFDSQDQNFTVIQPQGLGSCLVLESSSNSYQSSNNLDLNSSHQVSSNMVTQAAQQLSRSMIAPFIVCRNQR